MKILSFDIGIKNLAYVLLEHNNDNSKCFSICKWDIINLCNIIPNCSNCKKSAKFTKNDIYYCRQHTKNSNYKIPNNNSKNLTKQNLNTLREFANENDVSFNKNIKKTELLNLIEKNMQETYLNSVESVNANNIKLVDIGINLKLELNKLFSVIDLSSIDLILLENQISPIANRMKTIQGMTTQYFIDNNNYNIEFMSAANKLKLFIESKKTTYAERKKLSIYHTRELLYKKNIEYWLEFFNNHGKKDDLADCFLQGIYYLSTFNKLEI